MPWPPAIGDRLPNGDRAYGIHEKLRAYSLNLAHEDGGPKAAGFLRILGIGLADVEHLAGALRVGAREAWVVDIRDNGPFGITCGALITVAGIRLYRARVAVVRTAWELRHPLDRPRLVTAYIVS